jgi:hypothetical protein
MRRFLFTLLAGGLALGTAVCTNTTPAGPDTTANSGKSPTQQSAPVWISVSRGGILLGVIELQPGQRGSFTGHGDSADAQALQAKWAELDARNGIAMDMHLPPEDGKGRGAYGTRIFRAGEDGYSFALQHELEDAEFDVATSTTQLTVRSSPSTP